MERSGRRFGRSGPKARQEGGRNQGKDVSNRGVNRAEELHTKPKGRKNLYETEEAQTTKGPREGDR